MASVLNWINCNQHVLGTHQLRILEKEEHNLPGCQDGVGDLFFS